MKKTKKLLLSVVTLSLAFFAVVGGTYAWFTMFDKATVAGMEMNIDASEELQITLDKNSVWDYNVTVLENNVIDETTKEVTTRNNNVLLNTVTLDSISDTGLTFKKIQYNDATEEWDLVDAPTTATVKDKMDDTTNYDDSTSMPYIAFDLYLRSNTQTVSSKGESLQVNMFLSFDGADALSVKNSMRVAFRKMDASDNLKETIVYEVGKDTENTYGCGHFFNPNSDKTYEAYGPFLPFIEKKNGSTVYTLKDTYNKPYVTSSLGTNDSVENFERLDLGEVVHYEVIVWAEGWDGDAYNVVRNTTLSMNLYFEAAKLKDTATKYTAFFRNEDGSDVSQQDDIEFDSTVITIPEGPAKASDNEWVYTFEGWYDAKTAGTKLVADTKITSTDNVVYYARYTKTEREYTVAFKNAAGDDIENPSSSGVAYNTVLVFPADLDDPSKDFVGWARTKDALEAEYTSADIVNITEDLILYPVFTPII